jgi:hypothetical protein
MTAEQGLKIYRMSKIIGGHQSFWADSTFADEHLTHEAESFNASDFKEEEVLGGFFSQTLESVNEEGKRKLFELLNGFIGDNSMSPL